VKKHITILSFIFVCYFQTHGQDSLKEELWHKENLKIIVDFISMVKNKNWNELSTRIYYPFPRKYPIPEIKNKKDFLKRYREIFDDSLIKMIANSDPKEDWAEMGWRGIMFQNGEVWIDYEDGRLMYISYQSEFEKREREGLIEKEKKDLYPSLREFKEPACILETTKHRIRIDDLGNWNFRYASWPLDSKMSDKPEIVLEKGEKIFDGSGGNLHYNFKNAGYIYECAIIVMGESGSPPARLTIYKGDTAILVQKAVIIEK
jgi:hypothetical protein